MDARQLCVVIAALTLAFPSAFAQWGAKGAFEPDTRADATDGWMQLTPDRSTLASRLVVYFNGFSALGGAASTSANPNVALLRSTVATTPFHPVAMLGIWKDCNGDGYVGLADNGALEYRAELLLDHRVCPPTPPPADRPWLIHNDNRWVVEMVPIGYDDTTSPEDENPIQLNDTQARVWGDWGLPGAAPGLACTALPAPYGTFRSTGGLLRYVDCYAAFRGTRAVNEVANVTGLQEISFHDAPPDRPDQSGSLLNQANPWGSEGDAPMATVFDCSSAIPIAVQDPTDLDGSGDGLLRPVSDPSGRVVNATLRFPSGEVNDHGSPAGTVNETQAGLTDCDRSDTDEMVDLNGRRGGSDGDLPYALEGPNEPVTPYGPRRRTDHVLAFEEGIRGTSPLAPALGSRTRDDGGLGTAALTGFWVGVGVDMVGRNPYVSRSDVRVEPVTYVTYYAYIAPSLASGLNLVLPRGGVLGVYGAEACSQPQPTFDCDPSRWWRGASGENVVPRDSRLGEDPSNPTAPLHTPETEIGVRVGQRYQLRDVDCIDTSFSPAREGGAHWGRLTQTVCDRAP